MRGSYARMVGEAVQHSEVDLDATRVQRLLVHADVQRRAALFKQLTGKPNERVVGDDATALPSEPLS